MVSNVGLIGVNAVQVIVAGVEEVVASVLEAQVEPACSAKKTDYRWHGLHDKNNTVVWSVKFSCIILVMILTKPSHQILSFTPDPIKLIERAGRTCYRSEDLITDKSADKFVEMVRKRGHHSVIEHAGMTVRFVCDRGISHELVRHRLAAYSQESTRYVSSCEKLSYQPSNDEDIVDLYLNGFSMKKISELSLGNFTEWGVYKVLRKRSIKRRPLGNHGIRNQDAFQEIDTSEKAYLLGMLMSDGSMRSGGNQISISQKQGYHWYLKPIIEKVLGGDIGPGSPDRDGWVFSFSGERLIKDLKSKGIKPRKSKRIEERDAKRFFESIPKELLPTVIHGLMDGDGYIRFFKQRENSEKGSASMGFSGRDTLMHQIASWIKSTTEYNAKVKKYKDSDCCFVKVHNKEVVSELCQLMLKNFRFPFGHPKKTCRIYDELNLPLRFATWGSKKFQVIIPSWITPLKESVWIWAEAMYNSEMAYKKLREGGWRPERARSILPNSIKTEIVMTANFREWLHVFKLRCSKAAHPQMRELMIPLAKECSKKWPAVFGEFSDVGDKEG